MKSYFNGNVVRAEGLYLPLSKIGTNFLPFTPITLTAGVETDIPITGGNPAYEYTPTNYRFTLPYKGYYILQFGFNFTRTGGNNDILIQLKRHSNNTLVCRHILDGRQDTTHTLAFSFFVNDIVNDAVIYTTATASTNNVSDFQLCTGNLLLTHAYE